MLTGKSLLQGYRVSKLFLRFSCDFIENEVIYQHFGQTAPLDDRISLQIIYDTSTEKKVPITLKGLKGTINYYLGFADSIRN